MKRYSLLKALVQGGITMTAATVQADVSVNIMQEVTEGTLFITPHATSSKAGTYNYKVNVTKTGISGTAESAQAGSMLLIPGKKAQLSGMAFGLSGSEHFLVEVVVLHEGIEVSKKILEYPESKQTFSASRAAVKPEKTMLKP